MFVLNYQFKLVLCNENAFHGRHSASTSDLLWKVSLAFGKKLLFTDWGPQDSEGPQDSGVPRLWGVSRGSQDSRGPHTNVKYLLTRPRLE